MTTERHIGGVSLWIDAEVIQVTVRGSLTEAPGENTRMSERELSVMKRGVFLAVVAALLVGGLSGCGSSPLPTLPEAEQVDQIVAEVKVSPTGYPWRTESGGFTLPEGYVPRVLAAMTQNPSPIRAPAESGQRVWGILEFVLTDGRRIKVYLLGNPLKSAIYSIGDTSDDNTIQGGSQAGLEKVLREAYKEVNPKRFENINERPAPG